MDVVEEEHALAGGVEQAVDLGRVDARADEAVPQAVAVLLGLQAAHQPQAHVRQALVVEVDGVLGGQHDPDALRARLLQQGEQRPLGRRVRGWGGK